jgi:hypothetical protein
MQPNNFLNENLCVTFAMEKNPQNLGHFRYLKNVLTIAQCVCENSPNLVTLFSNFLKTQINDKSWSLTLLPYPNHCGRKVLI